MDKRGDNMIELGDLPCQPDGQDYKGEDRRRSTTRHFWIILALALLTPILSWVSYAIYKAKWETHVDDILVTLQESDNRHDVSLSEQKTDIGKRLDRMDDKLDQLLQGQAIRRNRDK